MIKYIFSDLDETLLVNHHVPQVNIDAISQARAKGVKFIIATGRSHLMTEEIQKEIGVYHQKDEYQIAYNGGVILECQDNKVLRFKGLDYKTCLEICEVGFKKDVTIGVFTLDGVYFFQPTAYEIERKIKQKTEFVILKKDEISSLKDKQIVKIFFSNDDLSYLMNIAKEMLPITLECLEVAYSSNRYLEFNALGVNKGEALVWLCEYLGGSIEETMAIGDSGNDISMIKTAGIGVAVKSAVDEVKQIANEITTRDYMEGAVAEMIEKHVL